MIHICRETKWVKKTLASPWVNFTWPGYNKGKAGEPNIDVTFTIDRNRVLNVTALDIETGTQNQVEITEMVYTTDNQIENQKSKSLNVL